MVTATFSTTHVALMERVAHEPNNNVRSKYEKNRRRFDFGSLASWFSMGRAKLDFHNRIILAFVRHIIWAPAKRCVILGDVAVGVMR